MSIAAEEARRSLDGQTIWLWHYLHADWQWEQSREWHEERYALAVEEVLDLMRIDEELTYFFDTASEFYEPVARLLGPRVEELKERVREGRIRIVSAQVANGRPNLIADETYLRNLQIGRAFFEANLPPTDLSLFHSVDIAIGHSQMPQILNLAGFSYYRAWRPHGPMNALGIPHQFHWQGMDGSTIMVTRGAYGGFYFDAHVPWDFETDWDGAVVRFYEHLLHDQRLHDRSPSNQLWAIQGCDDCRPYRTWSGDKPFDLPGFIARWRENESAPLNWCTPLEFSQAVAKHADSLPTVIGAVDGCDCSYNAANSGTNGLWTWRIQNDRRLLRAERWASVAASLGEPDRSEELTRLWAQHLVYQAHAEEFAFAEDFDHLVDLAQEVRLATKRIEESSLQAIALAAGGGDRLTRQIFNPNPWPVSVDVEVYHAPAVAGIESLQFVDSDGKQLPSQILSELRHQRYAGSVNDQHNLVRVDLPAFGYQTITIVESPEAPIEQAKPAGVLLETSELRLEFTGNALRSIVDLASGQELRAADDAVLPGLTFHALDDQNWLSIGPEISRSRFEPTESAWLQSGPLRWQHRSKGPVGPYQATVDLLIPDRGREIEVRVRLEGHWASAPQTGWMTMLMPVAPDSRVTVDVPFGVESRDPDHDLYAGSLPEVHGLGIADMFERLRPGWFWARSWADFSERDQGLTITGVNGNVFWQKDGAEAGPVLLRALKLTPDTWEARCAHVMTGSGTHEFSYLLRFHDGDVQSTDPKRRAMELHHPPVVVRANHPTEQRLSPNQSFIEIDGPAVLSATYLEDEHQIIRVSETTGQGGLLGLTFHQPVTSAHLIDLIGKKLDIPVVIKSSVVTFDLAPWQIATLQVGLADR